MKVKNLAIFSAVTLSALGACLWWVAQKPPAVSVPAHVCQGLVEGESLRDLFPGAGAEYAETSLNFVSHSGKGIGRCTVSAGGRALEVKYDRIEEREYDAEEMRKFSREPGSERVTLGSAEGYSRSGYSALVVPCPFTSSGKDVLEVTVEGEGGAQADYRSFNADALRAIANKVVGCGAAARIPAGDPTLP